MVGASALEVARRWPTDGQALAPAAVLRRAGLAVVGLGRNGLARPTSYGATGLQPAEGDQLHQPIVLAQEAVGPQRRVPSLRTTYAPSASVLSPSEAASEVGASFGDVPGATGNRAYVGLPTSTVRAIEAASVVAHGVPVEPARTIDQCPGRLASIRTRPQAGLRLRVTRRLVPLDGASELARAHEVALRATSIPRTTMP